MPLLPRTPRGTWIIAGVIWAAGTALLWWGLPVRPRAEWAISGDEHPIGFAAARTSFVTASVRGPDAERPGLCGPLRFRELDSGRLVDWFNPAEDIGCAVLSPDGAWVAVHYGRGGPLGLQLFET